MAFKKQPRRVSVTMVIEALKAQCAEVTQLETSLADARSERDAFLCELKAAGIPSRALVRYSGLSLSAVDKITAGAHRNAEALLLESALL